MVFACTFEPEGDANSGGRVTRTTEREPFLSARVSGQFLAFGPF